MAITKEEKAMNDKAIDILMEVSGDFEQMGNIIVHLAKNYPKVLIDVNEELLNPPVESKIVDELRKSKNKIPAIKLYRALYKDVNGEVPGLKEAKYAVEDIMEKHGISF